MNAYLRGAVFSVVGAAIAAAMAGPVLAWELETASDPFTDAESVTASHVTPDGNPPFSTVALVTCDVATGQVIFALDVGIQINTNTLFPFTYRVGSNDPRTVRMRRTRTNFNTGAFAGDAAIDLAREMAAGSGMVYRVTDEVIGLASDGRVDLTGAAGPIGTVLNRCGQDDR